MLSKTQVDRLGDRLRTGEATEADLGLLDSFRREFRPGFELIVSRIRAEFGIDPVGRPAKSTESIIAKLRRETVRLSQIQDIAGCRIVVPTTLHQDDTWWNLTATFDDTLVVDRRAEPSHGYRAVHVVVSFNERRFEVQVRTSLQHRWAELSEKLFDLVDPELKYGGGDLRFRAALGALSDRISSVEESERDVMSWVEQENPDFEPLWTAVVAAREAISIDIDDMIKKISGLEGKRTR